MNKFIENIPIPSNLSILYNSGSVLGLFYALQVVSGIFLMIMFNNESSLSFSSLIRITIEQDMGWCMRYIHSNGASIIFVVLYIHIFRGWYIMSYSKAWTWISGILLFILTMLVSFLGYILPWGQISYWAATVITNLLSSIPYFSDGLINWVWGDFVVSGSTLCRFIVLHFLLPLVMSLFIIFHIFSLHLYNSSNPTGSESEDNVPFYPFFFSNDMLYIAAIVVTTLGVVMLTPLLFIDPDNFINANSLVTPTHIKPEWYFLFAYSILRSIPNKLGGVVLMVGSVVVVTSLPWLSNCNYLSVNYYTLLYHIFYTLVSVLVLMSFMGGLSPEPPFDFFSLVLTLIFFFIMLAWGLVHL